MAKGKTDTAAVAGAALEAGVEDLAAGAELIDAAGEAARETVALAAEGAADVTSGLDQLDRAQSLEALSDLAADEAVADTVRGAATLEAAEETADLSALVAAVSADNLDRGMFLASLSGQLDVASNVVALMRMPVLSSFLTAKGRQLRGLAVNEIGRAMAAAALSEGMDSLSGRLAAIGLSEIAEGISELEAADELLDARDDAVSSGMDAAASGVAELSAAQAGARATRQPRRRRDGDGDTGRRRGRGGRRARGRRGDAQANDLEDVGEGPGQAVVQGRGEAGGEGPLRERDDPQEVAPDGPARRQSSRSPISSDPSSGSTGSKPRCR